MIGAGPSPRAWRGDIADPSLETFVAFVFFVVNSPFAGPGKGKDLVYREDREEQGLHGRRWSRS